MSEFIVARDPLTPPAGLVGAVAAIGNFDGLHRGHRGVVARAQSLAKKIGRPCVLLTFEPHPADVFAGRPVIFRLTPPEAKAAQAHGFIEKLPDGYNTHVNQRGVNLSGGQKQRIAIARALILRPAILILDDSTSSVDVETETKIHEAMAGWAKEGGMVTFMVAQRISTVLNADKIIVIDEGRIAAEGTHSQLMQSSPIYQEIFASQLGSGVN